MWLGMYTHELNSNSAIFDETVDNLFYFSSLYFQESFSNKCIIFKWESFMIYKYSQRYILYWPELSQCAAGIY